MAYAVPTKYSATITKHQDGQPDETENLGGHADSPEHAKNTVQSMIKERKQEDVTETITALKWGDTTVIP